MFCVGDNGLSPLYLICIIHRQDFQKEVRLAYTSETFKVYIPRGTSFHVCDYFKLPNLSSEMSTFFLFAQFLGRSFKLVQLIPNNLSEIKILQSILDIDYPKKYILY